MIRSFDEIREGETYSVLVSHAGPVNLYFKVISKESDTVSGTDIRKNSFQEALSDIGLDPENVVVKKITIEIKGKDRTTFAVQKEGDEDDGDEGEDDDFFIYFKPMSYKGYPLHGLHHFYSVEPEPEQESSSDIEDSESSTASTTSTVGGGSLRKKSKSKTKSKSKRRSSKKGKGKGKGKRHTKRRT
jgi:hypothetical protein